MNLTWFQSISWLGFWFYFGVCTGWKQFHQTYYCQDSSLEFHESLDKIVGYHHWVPLNQVPLLEMDVWLPACESAWHLVNWGLVTTWGGISDLACLTKWSRGLSIGPVVNKGSTWQWRKVWPTLTIYVITPSFLAITPGKYFSLPPRKFLTGRITCVENSPAF